MKRQIYFVTSNDNKAKEAAEILGVAIKRRDIELNEIQSMDLKDIVEHKAKEAYKNIRSPVIVEDVGLYLDDWNGFPGPFIKFVHSTIGYQKLPKLISPKNRKAVWTVAYGFYDGRRFQCFSSNLEVTVVSHARGKEGWGFDSLLIPKGFTKTFGELGGSIKVAVSPRIKAIQKMRRFLNKNSFRSKAHG